MRRDRRLDAPLTRTLLAWGVGLAVVAPPHLPAQSTGRVLGSVRELASGRPIPGASVWVVGTAIRADADGAGRFVLLNVPVGTHRVKIARTGFATLVEEVTVHADRATASQFQLPALDAMLDALTLRGRSRGPVEQRSDVPLGDLMHRTAPGIDLRRPSGQVGTGLRLSVRGVRSLIGPVPPLVYVDGIRVEFGGDPLGAGVSGPAILDVLDPATIARIRVLRGPEAAVYGLGATNGVILITTNLVPDHSPRR